MNVMNKVEGLEVGYNVPASVGMDEADIQTPCLVVDLDALERNVIKMGDFAKQMGVRHRVHGKMHKSVDVALLQEKLGGSCGVCCQKVSEAESFARGGIMDVLVSNQVRDPAKIDRLTSTMWPICPLLLSSTALKSSVWLRSTAGQGAAVSPPHPTWWRLPGRSMLPTG